MPKLRFISQTDCHANDMDIVDLVHVKEDFKIASEALERRTAFLFGDKESGKDEADVAKELKVLWAKFEKKERVKASQKVVAATDEVDEADDDIAVAADGSRQPAQTHTDSSRHRSTSLEKTGMIL
ncbi:unnamed protein product [Nippostrongylus brasiliensis]|uniref:RNA-directed DNA polymerase, eukaryota n=1 Tax=Nippostrongylus brasiliensis TaxID=27835 RepID=A0A0N4XFF7_NIPBR|nr:unnamed protein product [Nippostrongylus brasiliensis]